MRPRSLPTATCAGAAVLPPEVDWGRVRRLVNPEPSTALSAEASAARVRIQVSVFHTDPDGSSPVEGISSSTLDIPSATSNPYALPIGSGAQATFTAADPQRLRLRIEVIEAIDEQFVLDFDSASDPTALDTPSLTVPDVTLLLVGVVVLIPVLTTLLTNKRRRRVAIRIISLVLSVLMALGLLSRDVMVAVAAPDAFYLHTDSLNGGEMMNLTAGSGSGSQGFNHRPQDRRRVTARG